MKLYCRIEKTTNIEGTETLVIKEGPCELPQNSSQVSNLNLLDDETLQLFGWVSVETQSENKPVFVSVEYTILQNKVIEKKTTREETEDEINLKRDKEDYYMWQNIRAQRDQLLTATDKLVVIDCWEKLSLEEKTKIITYRQSLRDIPTQNSDPRLITFPVPYKKI